MTTTQHFDRAVFRKAVQATAQHRQTESQIQDVVGILNTIENSPELQAMWEKYRKQFAYAREIEYGMIMTQLRKLLLGNK